MNKDSVKQQMDDYPALDICDALFEWANEKDKMTIHRGEFLELSKKLAGLFAAAPAYKGDETTINNLNSTVMRWIEKYMIEDYGRQRWNKMTREEQAIILQNFLNDLVKAIEKIREIKLKTPI